MTGGGLAFLGVCILGAAFIVMSVRIYQVRPDIVVKVLRYSIIAAFGLIFSAISIAIGFRISERHSSTYARSLKSVQEIWGGAVVQDHPGFTHTIQQTEQYEDQKSGQIRQRTRVIAADMGFESQQVRVAIKSNVRKKGLLVFPGYLLEFKGRYSIRNYQGGARRFDFHFPLPAGAGNITAISVSLEGKPYAGDTNLADGISWEGTLQPGEQRIVEVAYSAQGTELFTYNLGKRKIEIKKLDVSLASDFKEDLIPEGAMVPTKRSRSDGLSSIEWRAENLVTGQNIAMRFAVPGNYGAVVSKIFFYSPMAIFLFLGLLVIFCVAREIRLHPIHFLFILTGFFVFYLLGSYLVSYIHVIPAIITSLAVSTAIVVYYCFLIARERPLITGVAFGLAVFQWVFSVAFFFPEHTGFLVTIASIIALIALMRATARMDWERKW